MGNLIQAFQNFMTGAKQMYGQGFDPKSMCMNMLRANCSTPQQALQNILNRGLINREQFDQFSRML